LTLSKPAKTVSIKQKDKICNLLFPPNIPPIPAPKRTVKKLQKNLLFYLPDKYISWPEIKITRHFSQVNDKQWKLKLKSNAIAKDVQISTFVAARLSDNFIDLIPPNEFEMTIDCEQQLSSIESVLRLRSLKSVFQTNQNIHP